jgi:hypothetical protein
MLLNLIIAKACVSGRIDLSRQLMVNSVVKRDSHSGGGVERAAAGEVKKDAERAEGDPEKEIMIAEGDGKDDAEDGGNIAEGTAKDEPGLDAALIFVDDGTLQMLAAKDE